MQPGKKLRRVRKDEVQVQSFAEPEPLDRCLECWKVWLASDPDKDLNAKTSRYQSSSFLTGDEAEQARTNEIGAATDAMIDSLSMLHRWAIYTMCGVPTAWNFPNADILIVGPVARDALTEKLKKNVGTRMLF